MNIVAILGLETMHKLGDTRFSETFMNNMRTFKKEHPKATIVTLDARNYRDLDDPMAAIWRDMHGAFKDGIDELIYFGHSDSTTLYVISKFRQELSDAKRFINMETNWDKDIFKKDANIYLYGCQTLGQKGVKFDHCICQDIANKTRVPAWGFLWRSSQQKDANGNFHQKPDRGGFVKAIPV